MKDMMVSRCVQFTEYVDIALQRYGVQKPSDEFRQRYFKTLGLPETAVGESYLWPSQGNQPSPPINSSEIPEELLIVSLFENVILHTQNFVRRLGEKKFLDFEMQLYLADQIRNYALAIMIFYFTAADKTDLKQKVMEKHEQLLRDSCGTEDIELREQFIEDWYQDISRKVQWLSVGTNTTNLKKNMFVQTILSGLDFHGNLDSHELAPFVEQFVRDIEISMKHFGILPKTNLGGV